MYFSCNYKPAKLKKKNTRSNITLTVAFVRLSSLPRLFVFLSIKFSFKGYVEGVRGPVRKVVRGCGSVF